MRLLVLLLLAPLPVTLARQGSPPLVSLGKPDVLPVEFTQVSGLRELSDGRVLVTDRMDHGVVVAQFGSSSLVKVGRTGRGPQEYRLPGALGTMPGDSVLLSDEGNQRLVVIGPDLKIRRAFTLMLPGLGIPMGARGQDSRGRFHMTIPGWAMAARGQSDDSIPIVRFDPKSPRVDTIARIKGATLIDGVQRGIPYVPFAPQDVWALAPDGRVAVARAGDYHIEWYAADGRVTRGPRNVFEALAVTVEDRRAYTRRFMESSSISGRNENEGMSALPASMLEESNVRRVADANTFAATKPPFTDAAPFISPEGTFWVERSGRLGDPSTWDVFNGAGQLVGRARLPPGRRLVGIGGRSLYLVATDDDGVQRLERYGRTTHQL
jgi:hypothetical protein